MTDRKMKSTNNIMMKLSGFIAPAVLPLHSSTVRDAWKPKAPDIADLLIKTAILTEYQPNHRKLKKGGEKDEDGTP